MSPHTWTRTVYVVARLGPPAWPAPARSPPPHAASSSARALPEVPVTVRRVTVRILVSLSVSVTLGGWVATVGGDCLLGVRLEEVVDDVGRFLGGGGWGDLSGPHRAQLGVDEAVDLLLVDREQADEAVALLHEVDRHARRLTRLDGGELLDHLLVGGV